MRKRTKEFLESLFADYGGLAKQRGNELWLAVNGNANNLLQMGSDDPSVVTNASKDASARGFCTRLSERSEERSTICKTSIENSREYCDMFCLF